MSSDFCAPLVSILVTNYNYSAYLRACLNSIEKQTYANIECIVVDNASSDNSLEVLEEIQNERAFSAPGRSLRVIEASENLQQMKSSILAFQHCTGSFVIFFDADDMMLPECVETHIRAAHYLRFPVGATNVNMFLTREDEIVGSNSGRGFSDYIASGKGQARVFCREVSTKLSRNAQEASLSCSDLHLVEPETSRDWCWSPTSALCFRREIVEIMFRRTPAMLANVDSYLIRSVNALTGSVLIDKPLVVYRHHKSNIFTRFPYLANIRPFDISRPDNDPRIPAQEGIATLTEQMGYLSKFLEQPSLYIEAICALSDAWPGTKPKMNVSNYTLGFLIENRQQIREHFGADIYRSWVKRFANRRIKDIFAIALSPLRRQTTVSASTNTI